MKNKLLPYLFVLIAVLIAVSLDWFQSAEVEKKSCVTTFARAPEAQLLINGFNLFRTKQVYLNGSIRELVI